MNTSDESSASVIGSKYLSRIEEIARSTAGRTGDSAPCRGVSRVRSSNSLSFPTAVTDRNIIRSQPLITLVAVLHSPGKTLFLAERLTSDRERSLRARSSRGETEVSRCSAREPRCEKHDQHHAQRIAPAPANAEGGRRWAIPATTPTVSGRRRPSGRGCVTHAEDLRNARPGKKNPLRLWWAAHWLLPRRSATFGRKPGVRPSTDLRHWGCKDV